MITIEPPEKACPVMNIERAGDTEAVLDVAAAKARIAALDAPPHLDLRAHARAAETAGRRSMAIFWALCQAMRGPGRLTVHEFFYYHLDDPSLTADEARRFVGKHRQRVFHSACNDVRWFAAAHDKALFYAAARGGGLPVPETLAVYAQGERSFAAEMLHTPEQLAGFLQRADCYPLFAKPIEGIYSVGVLSLAALEGTKIRFSSGAVADLDAVVRFIIEFGGEGFLLQRRLHPHPTLREAFGDTLPTIRFLVLLSPEGAAIESAVLKIPSSRNPADNYWRAGNMLGALDTTGSVRRAITGIGGALREVTEHPDTGTTLVGLAVPDWQQATDVCRYAAAMFLGIRTQSWDIALTDTGPVVLEFNFGGDLNLHQLAHRRGALTPTYIEHLKRCGYRRLKL
ncbi:MAG: sugar-transfer associated ATP-grasp domain-containing protein [Acetobacteraceae bacterium]|jgi:hypothetical protein